MISQTTEHIRSNWSIRLKKEWLVLPRYSSISKIYDILEVKNIWTRLKAKERK